MKGNRPAFVLRDNPCSLPVPFHTSDTPAHPSLPFLFCHLCANWHRALRHPPPTPHPVICQHCQLMWKAASPTTAHLTLFMSNPTTAEWARLWYSMSRPTDRACVTSVRPFWVENIASFSLSGSAHNRLLAASGCVLLSPTGKVKP